MNRELEALEEFYTLIENKKYQEAHEQMEDYWREIKKISKERSNPFKGLINGSTAFVLHSWKRKSYQQVWETYLKYCSDVELEDSESQKIFKKCKDLLEARFKELANI